MFSDPHGRIWLLPPPEGPEELTSVSGTGYASDEMADVVQQGLNVLPWVVNLVDYCLVSHHSGEELECVALAHRPSSPIDGKDYLTIRGTSNQGEQGWMWYWGHYDMSEEEARVDFEERG
jgi:hypothetical protein